MGRPTGAAMVIAALLGLAGGPACGKGQARPPQLVIGTPTTELTGTPAPGPTIIDATGSTLPADPGPLVDLRSAPRREPAPRPAMAKPDGAPPRPAVTYVSTIPVPDHLVYILVVGSDARPNEDVRRSNGDSVHLVAVNPRSGQGTIVGIPRDAWVSLPSGSQRKLSEVLRGGPEQMAATMRKLTGLPVDHYVLTGFVGFARMVDDLGGVDVLVDRRMDDPYSEARFERGWHHFTGKEALAYSRDRHDTAHGDFSRSEHHGVVMLAALAKMRAETSDDAGLRTWIGVLMRGASMDASLDDLRELASVARRLDPARIDNVVTPGRIGKQNGQSVVFLGDEAKRIFTDLRDDAVLGTAGPATTTTTVPPTTTTSAPPSTSTTVTTPLINRGTTTTTTDPDDPDDSTTTSTTAP